LDEFLLDPEGLAGGALGSMNLCYEAAGVAYSSSILGNNMGVGTGIALAAKAKATGGVTFIVTGDGAMEEGAFHESLMMLRAQDLAALVIVENNEWSMATRIDERRRPVDLAALAGAYGAGYKSLSGNDVIAYSEHIAAARGEVLTESRPVIVEVRLSTLGDWRQDGRFINYHAGPATHVAMRPWPPVRETDEDPVHVLRHAIDDDRLARLARSTLTRLEAEIA
jgi:pyruvate dehydrogenase E1 component alpha subunit